MPKKQILKFAVLLLITTTVLLTRAQASIKCESVFARTRAEALAAAVQGGDYEVKVLTGTVNGIQRTITILGESHVKSAQDAELGMNVVDLYDHIGYERNVYGGSIGSWLIGMSSRQSYRQAEKAGLSGSTTTYARNAKKDDTDAKLFHLEKGHRFNVEAKTKMLLVLADDIYRRTLNVGLKTWMLGLVYGVSASDPLITNLSILAPMTILNGHAALGPLANKMGLPKIYEKCFREAFCETRDPMMAYNTWQALKENPDVENILLIVGLYHIPGISGYLEQAGFKGSE